MNLSVSKMSLFNAINKVIKAVPSKSNLSNADCILLDAANDELRLVANNLELAIECIIPATVLEDGKVCLESKMFADIIRKTPDDDIKISTDRNLSTTIQSGSFSMNYMGKETDTFNDIPKFDYKDHMDISEYSLKEVIRQTIFSTSENEANKTLSGELFEIKDGILRVVSLDGQRVSIRRIEINDDSLNKKIIVPGRSLNELFKILGGDTEKTVTLHFTDNHLIVCFDNTTLVTRLIDGDFFNIDNVLTKDYETKVTINKKLLYDSVDRSTLFASDGDKRAIVLTIKDGVVELRMKSTKGSMDESIEIEKEGNDLKIGFNPKFLLDALHVIDDENIRLYFVSPKSPCFIRDDADSYTYMILPVNLGVEG